MTTESAKQVVGAYWGARAATFDEQFLHSIATDAERAAWERILTLLAGEGGPRDVLDVGCGTGFLALLFAARGHRVTGSDLAPEMIARAEEKARAQGAAVRFLVDDAEALTLPDTSFDLVVSRHLFWTLPHPERALAEWVRVTRPGGRIAIVDGVWDQPGTTRPSSSRVREEYGEQVIAALPNYGGAPAERVVALLRAHGLRDVQVDSLADLVAAQRARMTEEQRAQSVYVRYVVYGDRPAG